MSKNAAKAVDQKLETLTIDWTYGRSFLWQLANADLFTLDLYLWAVMIFDTRSFRPSLTTSMDALRASASLSASNPYFKLDETAMKNVEQDNFQMLLPVIDIGNHNGENHVRWFVDDINRFHITTTSSITKGEQIFNFYGFKPNSE